MPISNYKQVPSIKMLQFGKLFNAINKPSIFQ